MAHFTELERCENVFETWAKGHERLPRLPLAARPHSAKRWPTTRERVKEEGERNGGYNSKKPTTKVVFHKTRVLLWQWKIESGWKNNRAKWNNAVRPPFFSPTFSSPYILPHLKGRWLGEIFSIGSIRLSSDGALVALASPNWTCNNVLTYSSWQKNVEWVKNVLCQLYHISAMCRSL